MPGRVVGPLALVALSAVALFISWDYGLWDMGSPGAGLMPGLAAILLATMSLLALREKPPTDSEAADPDEAEPDPLRLARYCVALIALVPAIIVIGMLPALGVFIVLCLRIAERMSWQSSLAIALGGAGGSWLLFERLLQVPLPRGLWG